MDYNQIKEILKGLITDSTSTEDVQTIGALVQELDNKEKEEADLLQKHDELRRKYIEAVKDSSFKDKPKEENQNPKSFEECLQEAIAKRNKE